MKKTLVISILGIFTVLTLSSATLATNIAFVNLRKIMQESNVGKIAKEQIKTLIEAKKMVIKNKEKKIKTILNKLKNGKLSKTEKEKLQKQYETSMADLQQYQAQASEEVRKKEINETNKILEQAVNIIKDYAKKHHLDAVFEVGQGNVIYWNDSMDITNAIIKIMNSSKNKK